MDKTICGRSKRCRGCAGEVFRLVDYTRPPTPTRMLRGARKERLAHARIAAAAGDLAAAELIESEDDEEDQPVVIPEDPYGKLDKATYRQVMIDAIWMSLQSRRFLAPPAKSPDVPMDQVAAELKMYALKRRKKHVARNADVDMMEVLGAVAGTSKWEATPAPACGCPGLPCVCQQGPVLPPEKLPKGSKKISQEVEPGELWGALQARLDKEMYLHENRPPNEPTVSTGYRPPAFCLGLDDCFHYLKTRSYGKVLCDPRCKRPCYIERYVDAKEQEKEIEEARDEAREAAQQNYEVLEVVEDSALDGEDNLEAATAEAAAEAAGVESDHDAAGDKERPLAEPLPEPQPINEAVLEDLLQRYRYQNMCNRMLNPDFPRLPDVPMSKVVAEIEKTSRFVLFGKKRADLYSKELRGPLVGSAQWHKEEVVPVETRQEEGEAKTKAAGGDALPDADKETKNAATEGAAADGDTAREDKTIEAETKGAAAEEGHLEGGVPKLYPETKPAGCGCPSIPCVCYRRRILPPAPLPKGHPKKHTRPVKRLALGRQLNAMLDREREVHEKLADLPPWINHTMPGFCYGLDQCFHDVSYLGPFYKCDPRCDQRCKPEIPVAKEAKEVGPIPAGSKDPPAATGETSIKGATPVDGAPAAGTAESAEVRAALALTSMRMAPKINSLQLLYVALPRSERCRKRAKFNCSGENDSKQNHSQECDAQNQREENYERASPWAPTAPLWVAPVTTVPQGRNRILELLNAQRQRVHTPYGERVYWLFRDRTAVYCQTEGPEGDGRVMFARNMITGIRTLSGHLVTLSRVPERAPPPASVAPDDPYAPGALVAPSVPGAPSAPGSPAAPGGSGAYGAAVAPDISGKRGPSTLGMLDDDIKKSITNAQQRPPQQLTCLLATIMDTVMAKTDEHFYGVKRKLMHWIFNIDDNVTADKATQYEDVTKCSVTCCRNTALLRVEVRAGDPTTPEVISECPCVGAPTQLPSDAQPPPCTNEERPTPPPPPETRCLRGFKPPCPWDGHFTGKDVRCGTCSRGPGSTTRAAPALPLPKVPGATNAVPQKTKKVKHLDDSCVCRPSCKTQLPPSTIMFQEIRNTVECECKDEVEKKKSKDAIAAAAAATAASQSAAGRTPGISGPVGKNDLSVYNPTKYKPNKFKKMIDTVVFYLSEKVESPPSPHCTHRWPHLLRGKKCMACKRVLTVKCKCENHKDGPIVPCYLPEKYEVPLPKCELINRRGTDLTVDIEEPTALPPNVKDEIIEDEEEIDDYASEYQEQNQVKKIYIPPTCACLSKHEEDVKCESCNNGMIAQEEDDEAALELNPCICTPCERRSPPKTDTEKKENEIQKSKIKTKTVAIESHTTIDYEEPSKIKMIPRIFRNIIHYLSDIEETPRLAPCSKLIRISGGRICPVCPSMIPCTCESTPAGTVIGKTCREIPVPPCTKPKTTSIAKSLAQEQMQPAGMTSKDQSLSDVEGTIENASTLLAGAQPVVTSSIEGTITDAPEGTTTHSVEGSIPSSEEVIKMTADATTATSENLPRPRQTTATGPPGKKRKGTDPLPPCAWRSDADNGKKCIPCRIEDLPDISQRYEPIPLPLVDKEPAPLSSADTQSATSDAKDKDAAKPATDDRRK